MSGLIFYMHDGPGTFRFELSGKLAGGDVTRLEQAWRTASSTVVGKVLAVDVTFVSSADRAGRDLLRRWWDSGAHFVANSAVSRELVESVTGHVYDATEAQVGPTFEPRFVTGTLRAAFVAFLLVVTLLFPVTASASDDAGAVLDRYNALFSQKTVQGPVSVEIEGSLPKLEKQAHVSAIRRWTEGHRKYQFVTVEGDSFVRNEMIARYFAVETEGAEVSAPITKSNYKFRFVSQQGGTYVFQITPRKKKAGMIQGELWVDGDTGRVTHLAGRLVKNPSILLRHVDILQETAAGGTWSRETHLNMDTRLAGRAELTIRETAYAENSVLAEVENVRP